ncbi:MAG: hypothetical protein HRF40_09075 [Nitrososphaera sp.]|jgi:ribosomal protein L37AE/L43A
MEKEKEEGAKLLECKTCHLKFANEAYFESHMVMEHQKKILPSGVQ